MKWNGFLACTTVLAPDKRLLRTAAHPGGAFGAVRGRSRTAGR